MGSTRIGVSGWSYDSWRERFYPGDLPKSRRLHYASRCFNSIEINGSFYSLLEPRTYQRWYEETPAGFRFAVKGSRFITHNKKLKDIETPLANFLASGLLALQEKLGPIVWQLSEKLAFDEDRTSQFLSLLPRDTESAARLARRHDQRVEGRNLTRIGRNRRLRHAIEVRHESFFTPGFARIARRTGTAIVFSDSADWPLTEEITAGFIYIRLHGSDETYASRYSEAELDRWARRIRLWRRAEQPEDAETITDRQPPRRKSRDVYVYFDNDQGANAPHDALRLLERLKE